MSPILATRVSRGTAATPANIVSGDQTGAIGTWGYVNGGFRWLSQMNSQYQGNGTTLTTATYFSVGNGTGMGNPLTLLGDKVGINNLTPTEALHIAGGNLRYDHPSKGAGKVLTSDANGVATWGAEPYSRPSTPQYIVGRSTINTPFTISYPTTAQVVHFNNGYTGNNVTQSGFYRVRTDFYNFGTITGRYFRILIFPDGSTRLFGSPIDSTSQNTRATDETLFYLTPGLYKVALYVELAGSIQYIPASSSACAVNIELNSL